MVRSRSSLTKAAQATGILDLLETTRFPALVVNGQVHGGYWCPSVSKRGGDFTSVQLKDLPSSWCYCTSRWFTESDVLSFLDTYLAAAALMKGAAGPDRFESMLDYYKDPLVEVRRSRKKAVRALYDQFVKDTREGLDARFEGGLLAEAARRSVVALGLDMESLCEDRVFLALKSELRLSHVSGNRWASHAVRRRQMTVVDLFGTYKVASSGKKVLYNVPQWLLEAFLCVGEFSSMPMTFRGEIFDLELALGLWDPRSQGQMEHFPNAARAANLIQSKPTRSASVSG